MSSYFVFLLTLTVQIVLLAQATDLLAGHGGRISLAPALFAGVGAYSYAVLAVRLGWNPWVAFVVGCLIVTSAAMGLGCLLLKLNANGFLIGTFAAQVAFVDLVNNLNLTGGPLGIRDIPGPKLPFVQSEATVNSLALLVPALFISTLVMLKAVGPSSPLGRIYHWIRDDRQSAIAFGIPEKSLLRTAFVVHAVVSGIAGIGMAVAHTYIAPESFDLWLSLTILTAVFLGGTGGSSLGMIVGGVVLVALTELVNALPLRPDMVGAFQQIVLNGCLVGILVFRRRGLAGPIIEGGPSAARFE